MRLLFILRQGEKYLAVRCDRKKLKQLYNGKYSEKAYERVCEHLNMEDIPDDFDFKKRLRFD